MKEKKMNKEEIKWRYYYELSDLFPIYSTGIDKNYNLYPIDNIVGYDDRRLCLINIELIIILINGLYVECRDMKDKELEFRLNMPYSMFIGLKLRNLSDDIDYEVCKGMMYKYLCNTYNGEKVFNKDSNVVHIKRDSNAFIPVKDDIKEEDVNGVVETYNIELVTKELNMLEKIIKG